MNRKRQVSGREGFFKTLNSLIRVGGGITQASQALESSLCKSKCSLSSNCPVIHIGTENIRNDPVSRHHNSRHFKFKIKELIRFFRQPFSNQSARLKILKHGTKFINRAMNAKDSIVLQFSGKGGE